MEPLTLADVAQASRGRVLGVGALTPVTGLSIDSRTVGAGDLFACLPGERFDGHAFAEAARAAGAAALLVERPLESELPQVLVDRTLDALGRLGRWNRRRAASALVVAITGTNGKTGTKDLTAAALGSALTTVASPRSFNNQVGVPLTLLAARAGTGAIVVELGTNAPGEIAALAALTEPEVGVITNINAGHLQGLGSVAGVLAEKGSLLDALVGRRLAVLNRDDPSHPALAARAPGDVISFGFSPAADLRATDLHGSLLETRFRVDGGGPSVRLRHLGRHAVLNGLAALAVARAAGVDLAGAAEALSHVPPPPGRLQVRRKGQLTILDDSYNANPGSLAAAAAAMAELTQPGRRVFVVGDMLELGEHAHELHRAAGRALAQCFPRLLVAVGRYAEQLVAGAREIGLQADAIVSCADRQQAGIALGQRVQAGDVVLIKGSRRMALDTLVAGLEVGDGPGGDEAAMAP